MSLDSPSRNGSIPLEATVVASRKRVFCELADESVVLNLEDGLYYGMNAVASRVWQLIQEPRTVGEIRDSLLAEYDVETAACTRDLMELLGQFRSWKLIELKNEKSRSNARRL